MLNTIRKVLKRTDRKRLLGGVTRCAIILSEAGDYDLSVPFGAKLHKHNSDHSNK